MNQLLQTCRFTIVEILQMRGYQLMLVFLIVILPMSTLIFSNLFLMDIGKVRVDLLAAGESFISILYALIMTTALIGKDISQGTSYMFLSPPSNRRGYLLGRSLGIIFGLFVLMLVACLVGEAIVSFTMASSEATHRQGLEYGSGALIAAFTFYQYISLVAAIIFVCVWATGETEAFVFSIGLIVLTWSLPPVIKAIQTKEVMERTPEWIASLLQGISNLFPKLNGTDIGLALSHGLPIKGVGAHIAEHSGYALIMIGLAIIVFSKRDL